jgi:hypothetical protein
MPETPRAEAADPLCSPEPSRTPTPTSSSTATTASTASPHPYLTPTSGPGKLSGPAVRPFPRTDWSRVSFADPASRHWCPRQKTEWAGRAASQRWAAALDAGTLGGLDHIDFAVAVLDHVCEVYVYCAIFLTPASSSTHTTRRA